MALDIKSLPILELEHIHFNYGGEEKILQDISLAIYQGEKVALLGANGSGKSTVQKILNGLIYPQEGIFRAFGQAVDEKLLGDEQFSQDFHRRVGFVFQNSDAQLFSPTVWEDIAFGPLQMDLPRSEVEARVQAVMEMLGLESLKERPPHKLSGGEKKKVAIASVLVINPDILILDEPTAGLDPRTQRWLVKVLVQLNRAGKTLITATHDLDIVDEIADRAIVMGEEHRILAAGPIHEIMVDKDLLLQANLIDEEYHQHFHESPHRHFHSHWLDK
ncbi:MAG: energy-coupling factor ABC transporter ATP-binding protein [Bacillota bacterium]